MGRGSKEIEKFISSLEAFRDANRDVGRIQRRARVFDDELFIFYESTGSTLRRSADDYFVIGGRSNRAALSGSPLLADVLGLSGTERRRFGKLLNEGGRFVVLPARKRAAIVYCGLLGSCGLGVVSLTNHPSEVAAMAKSDEYDYLFNNTLFSDGLGVSEVNELFHEFINTFRTFETDMKSACGREEMGDGSVEHMAVIAAELIGCGVRVSGTVNTDTEHVDRDALAAMFLCLFSAIRSVSPQRRAELSFSESDGDIVVKVEFDTAPELINGKDRFLDFCRLLSERNYIPFACDISEGHAVLSFIPTKIDPSASGLKEGLEFDFKGLARLMKGSDGAR